MDWKKYIQYKYLNNLDTRYTVNSYCSDFYSPLHLQLLLGGVDAEVPEEVAELLGGHEAGLRLVELVECLHELEDV